MATDSFVREKFTRERSAARKLAKAYFVRYPKDRYLTEVETWCEQSTEIEFTMKRLRRLISISSANGVRTLLRSAIDKSGPSKSWHERRWRRAGLYKLGLKMEDYEKYFESRTGKSLENRCSTYKKEARLQLLRKMWRDSAEGHKGDGSPRTPSYL